MHSIFLYEVPPQIPDYALFAYPLNFLALPVWTHSFFFPMLFDFLLVMYFSSQNRYLKIITSILVLLIFSIKYSYGKIDHENHTWMIFQCFNVFFFSLNQFLNSKTNLFILRLTQALFFEPLLYFRIMETSCFVKLFTERYGFRGYCLDSDYICQ